MSIFIHSYSSILNEHKQQLHYISHRFQCTYCPEFDTNEYRINQHILKEHGMKPMPQDQQLIGVLCPICEEEFHYKMQRDHHLKMCRRDVHKLRTIQAGRAPEDINMVNRWFWDKPPTEPSILQKEAEQRQQQLRQQQPLLQQQRLQQQTMADANAGSNVHFEWMNSVFLRAYRDGLWLVVEDVNSCNAAVLDCLISCLESADGDLVLPVDEARTIRRHPNFRIFFTMDPRNGQLSRAMRNRAVEVHFCTDQSLAEESLWSANIFDAISAIFGSCPSNIHSKCNSAQTHAQLRRLQAALSEHSTQSLLNCMAQLQAKMDWSGPINTEKGFQQALSVLLASLEEEKENHSDDGISLNSLATPTEFPPLTRPLVPMSQNMAKFHLQLISYYRRCFRELSNNNKPDDAFFAVSTQIAKRMREFVLQEIVLTDITSLDELLEKTFPELEVANHVWKQFSLTASNETPEGQAYLRALRTHAECRPFQTHQQLKQFSQKWREEEGTILAGKTGQEEELDPATVFGPFQWHLAWLYRLLSLAFADIDGEELYKSSLALLPWKRAENGQLFAFSHVMSTKFDGSETLFTHLQTPHLTSSANQLLWAPLHYNRNILYQILISQLSNAHNEFEQIASAFLQLPRSSPNPSTAQTSFLPPY